MVNPPTPYATFVRAVADGLTCIGRLGTDGCGFEQTLEAARRALDPKRNVNPGFLRPGAALLILFLSDEDDCSAEKVSLFTPQQQALSDPLGPLTSFRCFEFGVSCDINDRNKVGLRKNCVPDEFSDWLYKIDGYKKFFATLDPGKPVVMAGIIGPGSPVNVGKDGSNPMLAPSCQTTYGFAVPPIRILELIVSFGGTTTSICERESYGSFLFSIGKKLNP